MLEASMMDHDSSRQELTSKPNLSPTRAKSILKKPTNFIDMMYRQKQYVPRRSVQFTMPDKKLIRQFSASRTKRMLAKQRTFSSWTLNLTDPLIQSEFLDYRRRLSRSYGQVLCAIQLVPSLIALIAAAFLDEKATKAIQFGFLMGTPSAVGSILLAFSYKKLFLVELTTPVMYVIFTVMFVVINATTISGGYPTELDRQNNAYLVMLFYLLQALYFGANWFFNFIVRLVFFLITLIGLIAHRYYSGDDTNPFLSYAIVQFVFFCVEASVYINVRAQAFLFIKIKAVEQQEAQLSNLLNAVPDSVFICTRKAEQRSSQGVYANFRMNQFFGQDVINLAKKAKGLKRSSSLRRQESAQDMENSTKKRSRRVDPLQLRIFAQKETAEDLDGFSNLFEKQDANASDIVKVSLLDIVQQENDRARQRHTQPNQGSDSSQQQNHRTYEVTIPNPYADERDKKKIVTIKVLDVLFNDQACSLVYIQDMTQFVKENEQKMNNRELLLANAQTSENLQGAQETIINLTKQLIETSEESQQETLRGIQLGTRLMQLMVMNFTEFVNLKHGAFSAQEKLINVEDTVEEIIDIHQVDARQYGLRLVKEQFNSHASELVLITEASRVALILQNVIRKVFTLARKDTEIKIDYWTELQGWEGSLFFSVSFQGDEQISQLSNSVLFSEQVQGNHLGGSQQLSMLISKQLCDRMKGRIRFETTLDSGLPSFIFSLSCYDARDMQSSNLASSAWMSNKRDSIAARNFSNRQILLITRSVIDRLALQMILSELNLKKQLSVCSGILESLKILSDFSEASHGNLGFFMVIIDTGGFDQPINQIANAYRNELNQLEIKSLPELVFFTDNRALRDDRLRGGDQSKEREATLTKPFRKHEFVRMLSTLRKKQRSRPQSGMSSRSNKSSKSIIYN